MSLITRLNQFRQSIKDILSVSIKTIEDPFEVRSHINLDDRSKDAIIIVKENNETSIPALILTEAEVISLNEIIEANKFVPLPPDIAQMITQPVRRRNSHQRVFRHQYSDGRR